MLIPALESGFSGRPRELLPGAQVHRTAIERFAGLPHYRPPTLLDAGLTSTAASAFLAGGEEQWTVPSAV